MAQQIVYIWCYAGTYSNPFSLDALAVFMFRVLQRVNHPVQFQSCFFKHPLGNGSLSAILRLTFFFFLKGNLDKASPNAGYVLLMFYHLYEGKA